MVSDPTLLQGLGSDMDRFGSGSTIDDVLDGHDLRGKRIFITGTSAGLGLETMRALVGRGAEVVGGVMNLERAAAATARLAAGNLGTIRHIPLDLGSLSSIRHCTDELAASGLMFDAVIANAGIMACPKGLTEDGFERHFGINHLGHFALLQGMRRLIREGGRVVCLSSNAHRSAVLHLDDPNFVTTPYDEWVAYGRSKAANAIFAIELDRRWSMTGIRACAVHPGGIMTSLDRHLPVGAMTEMAAAMDRRLVVAGKPPLKWKSVAQGAATTAWSAFEARSEGIGGRYCEDCRVAPIDDAPDRMSGARSFIYDPDLAERLWNISTRLTMGPIAPPGRVIHIPGVH